MAMPAYLEQKWRQLNYVNQRQADNFIDFLLAQQNEQNARTEGKSNIRFGVWNKEPFFIADDFDETPDDFKEYM